MCGCSDTADTARPQISWYLLILCHAMQLLNVVSLRENLSLCLLELNVYHPLLPQRKKFTLDLLLL